MQCISLLCIANSISVAVLLSEHKQCFLSQVRLSFSVVEQASYACHCNEV